MHNFSKYNIMSELLVKPGSWTSFTASEAEAFLASVSRPFL